MDILIQQEIELHQYEVRQNIADIERLIHPSFTEVGRSGRSFDFASIIDLMASEEPTEVAVHSQDFECIKLEPSTHLLKYKSALISLAGEESSFTKRSSIWVFNGERWQLKYHQGTPCEPFTLNR
ncbi:DUF4440 domain-containing protein [Vibrio vulnificus]|uniref:nuclear transport factor 2 family protein n=1 Tax=Vibrio vulnificus TaxID=672 RepID=UPI002FD6C272